MAQHDDGGSAFPISKDTVAPNGHAGMSLRDYFASQIRMEADAEDFATEIKEAAVGRPCPGWLSSPLECLKWHAEWRAVWRYMQADAMLKERSAWRQA